MCDPKVAVQTSDGGHRMSERQKSPTVVLEPHKRRILNALLYLISEANHRSVTVSQYQLVKALFLADKAHLNRFGRPITYDNYVAMENGPVPRFAYECLKHKVDFEREFGFDEAPWTREPAPELSKNAFKYTPTEILYNVDVLSASDLEALSQALSAVSLLTFSQLRMITHQDAAYLDAWEEGGGKRAYPMSYGLLFEAPDFEQADSIAMASKNA